MERDHQEGMSHQRVHRLRWCQGQGQEKGRKFRRPQGLRPHLDEAERDSQGQCRQAPSLPSLPSQERKSRTRWTLHRQDGRTQRVPQGLTLPQG